VSAAHGRVSRNPAAQFVDRIGGNVLDFVAAMEKCSIRDAVIKLQMWFLVPAAGANTADGKEPHAEISPGKELVRRPTSQSGSDLEVVEPNKPLTFQLQNLDCAHPYLTERGVDELTARQFGVAFFPGKGTMHGRVVIPIHNANGELVAYAGRAIDEVEPKYKFPVGFRKSLELYNLHRVTGEISVVLVEGFFDCIRVTQAGFPCVALMGCAMSRTQEEVIARQFAHAVVMLDGDIAGQEAAYEIAERLRRIIFQVDVVNLRVGTQPDHLREEELRDMLRGTVTIQK
jgi:hypothetical protein